MQRFPHPADRVLLGLGNTVDWELEWDDDRVSALVGELGVSLREADPAIPVESGADLLRTLLAHVADGSGGEHYVSSAAALRDAAERFDLRTTLGGTNVRAALAMRALGVDSTVHLVSTNDVTRRLLPPGIRTISAAAGDSVDPHLIVQFPGSARVRGVDGEIVAPRPNRVIYTHDRPNRELPVTADFGTAAARADVILVSGFNSMQDPTLIDERLTTVRRHVQGRRADAVAVYEHGAFHVAEFSERVREALRGAFDVWCCNEDELMEHVGHPIDLLDAGDVLRAAHRLRAAADAATLIVHTRHWALALGGPEGRRRDMIASGVALSGARYAHGDAVSAVEVAEALRRDRQREGTVFAECAERLDAEVSVAAGLRIPTATPTTIGLGDAFVGGVVAALARSAVAQDSETRIAEVPGTRASKTWGASPG